MQQPLARLSLEHLHHHGRLGGGRPLLCQLLSRHLVDEGLQGLDPDGVDSVIVCHVVAQPRNGLL